MNSGDGRSVLSTSVGTRVGTLTAPETSRAADYRATAGTCAAQGRRRLIECGDGLDISGGYVFELSQPLATIIAGGAVMAGAAMAFGSATLSRRMERRHHDDVRGHDRDRLRADRYSACAEQLGHTSPAVRMAGVYGMLSLADEWVESGNDSEAQSVIDVIRSYIRVEPPRDAGDLRGEMNVRKAVLEELSRRSSWWATARDVDPTPSRWSKWQHLRTDLPSAMLSSIDLRRAHFAGINLSGSDLSNADLSGSDFEVATLSDASLTGSNCAGMYARDASFDNTDFRGADLRGSTLTSANLTDANLSGADLRGATLTNAAIEGVNFDGANVDGMTFDLEQVEGRGDLDDLVGRGARVRSTRDSIRTVTSRPAHLPEEPDAVEGGVDAS